MSTTHVRTVIASMAKSTDPCCMNCQLGPRSQRRSLPCCGAVAHVQCLRELFTRVFECPSCGRDPRTAPLHWSPQGRVTPTARWEHTRDENYFEADDPPYFMFLERAALSSSTVPGEEHMIGEQVTPPSREETRTVTITVLTPQKTVRGHAVDPRRQVTEDLNVLMAFAYCARRVLVSDIASLPVVSDPEDVCMICRSDEETQVALRCGHHGHPQCLNKWISLHETCPLCRSRHESCIDKVRRLKITPEEIVDAMESLVYSRLH